MQRTKKCVWVDQQLFTKRPYFVGWNERVVIKREDRTESFDSAYRALETLDRDADLALNIEDVTGGLERQIPTSGIVLQQALFQRSEAAPAIKPHTLVCTNWLFSDLRCNDRRHSVRWCFWGPHGLGFSHRVPVDTRSALQEGEGRTLVQCVEINVRLNHVNNCTKRIVRRRSVGGQVMLKDLRHPIVSIAEHQDVKLTLGHCLHGSIGRSGQTCQP